MEQATQADPAPNLDEMAAQIRRHFASMKSEQRNTAYRPHARFRNEALWLKAAEVCARLRASPYSYVLAAFLYNNVPGGPFPQQMGGKAAEKWYRDYCKVANAAEGEDPFARGVQAAFVSALRMATGSPLGSACDALMSDLVEADAFIKLLLMIEHPPAWIKYGRAAARQLSGNPQLVDVLVKSGTSNELLKRIIKYGEQPA